jgi:hypothetical protein
MVDNLPLFIEGKLTSSEFVDTVVKVTERDAQL